MHRARDIRFSELGRRQHGAIARDQLLAIGFSRHAVDGMIARGLLQPIHEGIFAIGPQLPVRVTREFAALLAIRPDPLLSHVSSAAHQDLMAAGPAVHVSITTRVRRDLTGVVVHRPRRIEPEDIVRIDNLPMTSIPRTLLDLAQILPLRRLEKAIDAADRHRSLDVAAMASVLERYRGHRGGRNIRRILGSYLSTPDAEEGIERDFQEFLDEYRLPMPELKAIVEDLLVDCWWPAARFVVELDSKGWHKTWQDHERDRKRDAILLRADIASLRVTYWRLHNERDELARDIAAGLAFRRTGTAQPA